MSEHKRAGVSTESTDPPFGPVAAFALRNFVPLTVGLCIAVAVALDSIWIVGFYGIGAVACWILDSEKARLDRILADLEAGQ